MAFKPIIVISSLIITAAATLSVANAFTPYTTRSLWDPSEDPFRILEQSPLNMMIPSRTESPPLALLARADWKETASSHVIALDLPGLKKDDVKIEVEDNRVLRISGERKAGEEEGGNDKWHRAERSYGKFWRQFRLPGNADLDRVKAHLEDGVLRITVPKLGEEKRRQARLIDIVHQEGGSNGGDDIDATRADA